jgi:hypothetical protein
MADPTSQQTLINYLLGAFGTLAAGIGLHYKGKVDTMEKNQVNFVTHQQLQQHLDKIAEERRSIAAAQLEQHKENRRWLERIEDSVSEGLGRIHERIDKLPIRPASERTRSTDP